MNKKTRFVILVGVLIYVSVLSLFLIAANFSKKQEEAEEGEIIFIENNSIGCSKYRKDGSVFWVCPKDMDISSIETRKCYGSGKYLNCRTEQEPVL